MTDVLFLFILANVFERQDVATADVVGAYLNALMDDKVLVQVCEAEVNMLCKVNPEYTKLTTHENSNPVLYLRLVKALYRCIWLALLWYNFFLLH